MAALVLIIIIAGCIAFNILKSDLLRSLATFLCALSASFAAYAYFEVLANVALSRQMKFAPWAQTLAFVLLFVLAFAILRTIAQQLTKQKADFGLWPEKIGRGVFGLFLGLVITGVIFSALDLAPISAKFPYQRFDQNNAAPLNPQKALFSPDGFTSGLFSLVSKGSLSGKNSFAVLHPDFATEAFLNRLNFDKNISAFTETKAIEVPTKKAAWPVDAALKDEEGANITTKAGYQLMTVRVGFKKSALKDISKFKLFQLRLVHVPKADADAPLAGSGTNTYPIGYISAEQTIAKKKPNDLITLKGDDFTEKTRYIDFVFEIPNDSIPALIGFKQNNIAGVPTPVTADQAPEIITFSPDAA